MILQRRAKHHICAEGILTMILTTIYVSYPLAVYILQNDQDTTEKKQSSGILDISLLFHKWVP